jgi:hypothetical protein
MDSNLPEVVPVALEGPGVVALLLSLQPQLVLEVLVGGQLALHLDAPASLQSHLHSEYCKDKPDRGSSHQSTVPVLRIQIWCLFDPWIRDPGWVKSGINNPYHISESLETIF